MGVESSGTVLAGHVAPGDTVAQGQLLMIVEAMKMEHRITAPCDGVVYRPVYQGTTVVYVPQYNPAIVYGASKAAVSMLTLQYSKAVPDIKFNAVEPGWVKTPMSEPLTADPEALRYYNERVALHRGAEPAELAAAIAWLLSPDASYVTSATLLVDGGFIVNAEL